MLVTNIDIGIECPAVGTWKYYGLLLLTAKQVGSLESSDLDNNHLGFSINYFETILLCNCCLPPSLLCRFPHDFSTLCR